VNFVGNHKYGNENACICHANVRQERVMVRINNGNDDYQTPFQNDQKQKIGI